MDALHHGTVGLEAREEVADVGAERGERAGAGRVGRAVGHEAVERALRVACGRERQAHVVRRHAVEHHAAHLRFVLAQIDKGRTRAV